MRTARMFLVAVAVLCCINPAAHADRAREEVTRPISGAISDEFPNHFALALLKTIEVYKKRLVKLEAMSANRHGKDSDVDARNDASVEHCKKRIETMERYVANEKRKQRTEWHLRGLPGER